MVKVLAGGLTSQVFVVLSNSSSLERKIRIQPEKSSVPHTSTKIDGEKNLQIK